MCVCACVERSAPVSFVVLRGKTKRKPQKTWPAYEATHRDFLRVYMCTALRNSINPTVKGRKGAAEIGLGKFVPFAPPDGRIL